MMGVISDPWDALRRECHAMSVWYGGNALVSAYVGLDAQGTFFGGVHVDGEVLDEVEVEYRNGDTDSVAIELVRQMKAYRKRMDEMAAEERDAHTG